MQKVFALRTKRVNREGALWKGIKREKMTPVSFPPSLLFKVWMVQLCVQLLVSLPNEFSEIPPRTDKKDVL